MPCARRLAAATQRVGIVQYNNIELYIYIYGRRTLRGTDKLEKEKTNADRSLKTT